MSNPAEHLGVLIGAARRRIKRAVVARLAPLDIDPPLFWTLLAVQDFPGASLGELAHGQLVDLPSMSRNVARLAGRGLVRLVRSEEDRRRGQVELTAAGKQLAQRARRVADEVRDAVSQDLSARQHEALCATLKQIIANLEQLDEKDESGTATAARPARRARRPAPLRRVRHA